MALNARELIALPGVGRGTVDVIMKALAASDRQLAVEGAPQPGGPPGRDMGERGLLAQFPAVVVGVPKATSLDRPVPVPDRERYRTEQREAVLTALARYGPAAMVVFGVDLGHTDPQWVLPYGGELTVDGPARRLTAHY